MFITMCYQSAVRFIFVGFDSIGPGQRRELTQWIDECLAPDVQLAGLAVSTDRITQQLVGQMAGARQAGTGSTGTHGVAQEYTA